MVANGFIVLINFMDWFRRRKLSPTDLILISLALSRVLQQALAILDAILFSLLNNKWSNVLFLLTGVWIFTNAVNLWFAACLSVFYLAKIAIFSHPVFLQFKRQLSGLVPWLLLGSVVFSSIVTIIVLTSWKYGLSGCSPFKSLPGNRSNAEMNMLQVCRNVIALITPFNFIPLMVFLSSSVLLISSLWMHVRRVRNNGTGIRDLNTQAHLSAIKALASFAVLYLLSFAVHTSQLVLTWTNQRTLASLLFNVSAVYPSGHAIILILINPKLKQAWVRMMHPFKCCLNKAPSLKSTNSS
ncbi:taste receptor type 2 member 8-like [Heteronotia binoei]|uniref:taste receptor type 2 member 8-like n=1 Tax=Heteronotia binoei TaxID=13085 RepID=UPI002930C1EF|nr:taste receptor type 2 member 8-like [Heteronotia binoei]